jgi:hypothetical protein
MPKPGRFSRSNNKKLWKTQKKYTNRLDFESGSGKIIVSKQIKTTKKQSCGLERRMRND